jgi:acid phosphatase
MQTAVEYRMVCESAYRAAAGVLGAALADRTWSAAVEQIGDVSALPPAVVLDLDETVLDNSRFQGELVRRRLVYTPELWREWVRQRRAELVPGAGAFLAAARERGVAVIFITNRTLEEEADTVANLAALGVDAAPESIMCAGENGWPSDKAARRTLIAGTHRIVALVGDDLGDFVPARVPPAGRERAAEAHEAWWGTRWIVLPNPAYGSWERALLGYASGLSDEQSLQTKRALVKGFTD